MIQGKRSMSKALISAIVGLRTFVGVEGAEEQAPTDDGAEVLVVFLSNGNRLAVTIEELGPEEPEPPESTPGRTP